MGQQAGVLVDDLIGDASDGGGDDGFFLPQGFGERETETFARTFLDDDARGTLKGVDVERSPRGQLEDFNVGIVFRVTLDLLEHFGASRVVRGRAASKHQLTIEIAADDAISADDADGVLKPIEAGDLREDGTERVDRISCE